MIKQLLLTKALSEGLPDSKKSRISDCLFLATTILIGIGLLFLVFALYVWLKANYDLEIAALLTSVAAFGLACVAAGVAIWTASHKRSHVNNLMKGMRGDIMSFIDGFTEDMEHPIRSHPKAAIFLAAVIGYVLGDRIL